MKHFVTLFMLTFFLVLSPALAEETGTEDLEIYGLEVEKLLNLGSGLLAAILALITFLAYQKRRNTRLAYVAAAFLFFAVKGFLMGVEIFMGEVPYVDPITSILDFIILFSFFLGIIKE